MIPCEARGALCRHLPAAALPAALTAALLAVGCVDYLWFHSLIEIEALAKPIL